MANTLNLGTDGNWGVKKDSLLAYNSENGNFKPLPFDFTRASSATVVNKAGLIETVGSGEPRIDFKDDTKGALLLEPSRTNSNINSENFLATNYNYVGRITRTPNAAVSPDGLQNAYAITETTDNGTHLLGQATWNQSISDTSVSVFAKANGRKYIVIGNANMAPSMNTWFDLENGVVGTQNPNTINATIEPYGNGWYRCSISYLPNKGNTYPVIYLSDTDGGSVNYQGDGVSGVYLWGYQIEVNASYATSYIPTSGSAVTRVGEVSTQTPPDGIIGQTEGVLFFDGYYGDEVSEIYLFTQSSTGTGVSDSMYLQKSGASSLKFIGRDASATTQWDITGGSFSIGQKIKVAAAYKNNDVVLYINGLQIGADLVALIPTMSNVKIGGYPSQPSVSNYFLSKPVNDVKLYNTRLSNTELAILTTI